MEHEQIGKANRQGWGQSTNVESLKSSNNTIAVTDAKYSMAKVWIGDKHEIFNIKSLHGSCHNGNRIFVMPVVFHHVHSSPRIKRNGKRKN